MIRSRVASFIVALNPTMSVESKIDLQKTNNIDKGFIECLGMKFGNNIAPSFPSKMSSKTDTSGKLIINAKSSGVNQAYIIAACIENI